MARCERTICIICSLLMFAATNAGHADELPRIFLSNPKDLAQVRQLAMGSDAAVTAAVKDLRTRADHDTAIGSPVHVDARLAPRVVMA